MHFDLSGYLESLKLGQGQRNCHGRVGVNQWKLFESSHLHSLQESDNVFCFLFVLVFKWATSQLDVIEAKQKLINRRFFYMIKC